MNDPVFISSYQCARLLQRTKKYVRWLLDSREIDYFRDAEQIFRIRLDSVLEYANRTHHPIDMHYYAQLTRQTGTVSQSEQNQDAEDSFPSGKTLWRVGASIAARFRNRRILNAIYKDERLVDMMFRYFSGETLEQIGDAYGVTRERARQLCEKGLNRLIGMISYFTKDIVEMEEDKEAMLASVSEQPKKAVANMTDVPGTGLEKMGFSRRALTVFKKQGITSLTQLRSMSRQDLIKLPNLGRKTLAEITAVLGDGQFKRPGD